MHSDFFQLDFQDWLLNNLYKDFEVGGRDWRHLFAVVLDNLWRNRNKGMFEKVRLHPTELMRLILQQAVLSQTVYCSLTNLCLE